MHKCLGCDAERSALLLGIQRDIDLILVKVCARGEQRRASQNPIGMEILSIRAFLIPRVVLLDAVAVDGIVEEEREIRVEIEKRPADEAVNLETVARCHAALVIDAGRSQADASSIAWVDISE